MNAIEKEALPRVLQPEPGDRHQNALFRQDNPLVHQSSQPRECRSRGRFSVRKARYQ